MPVLEEKKQCFVIAPIGEEGSDTRKRSDQILKHIIKPAAEQCGYVAHRADEIDKPGLITSQVIQRVAGDPLVIADLSEMNPNVFYELAIRHAIRKPLVQIIEKGQRIPFDVAATRTIHVDHRDLDSVDSAKRDIIAQIKSLEKSPDEVETPISVSIELQSLRQSDNPEDRSLAELLAELSDMRVAISKLSEVTNGRSSEEFNRLRAYLDEVLEGGPRRSRSVARYTERSIVNAARDLESPDAGQRALGYATIASVTRDRIPWVYEGAAEVFRQISFSSENKANETEKRFRAMIRNSLESQFVRDSVERDEGTYMVLDMLRSVLH